MKQRPTIGTAGLLAVAGMLFFSHDSLAFDMPLDPYAPTSNQQCHDLYASYRSRADALAAEAKSISNAARNAPYSEERYRRVRQLYDEAFAMGIAGSQARTRCMSQVFAYEESRKATERTSETMRDIPRLTGTELLKSMLGAAQKYPGSPRFRAAAGVARAMTRLDMLKAAMGGGRSETDRIIDIGRLAGRQVGRLQKWNALQRSMYSTALKLTGQLHRAANEDLDAGLARFGSPLDELLERRKHDEILQLGGRGGSGGGAPVAPEGAMDQLLGDARSASEQMIDKRSAAYSAAMAAQAETAQASAAREAARPKSTPTRKGGGGSSAGGGTLRFQLAHGPISCRSDSWLRYVDGEINRCMLTSYYSVPGDVSCEPGYLIFVYDRQYVASCFRPQ